VQGHRAQELGITLHKRKAQSDARWLGGHSQVSDCYRVIVSFVNLLLGDGGGGLNGLFLVLEGSPNWEHAVSSIRTVFPVDTCLGPPARTPRSLVGLRINEVTLVNYGHTSPMIRPLVLMQFLRRFVKGMIPLSNRGPSTRAPNSGALAQGDSRGGHNFRGAAAAGFARVGFSQLRCPSKTS